MQLNLERPPARLKRAGSRNRDGLGHRGLKLRDFMKVSSWAISRAVLLATLLTVALLTGGCGSKTPGVATSGGPVKVLATTSFLADIAQNVAGSRLMVQSLIPVGANPHEYQPAPKDAATIGDTQVLIVNGLGYEAWLTNLLGASDHQPALITATNGLQPIGEDPHMWMDPQSVVQYVENIRLGLSKVDPAGAPEYATNAAAYTTSLKALDAWIKDQVSQVPADKRMLVTNHDELGYFARAYGLKVVGAVIPNVTSEAGPSAQQMAQLIQTVRAAGVPAIFLDVNENRNLAQQIASETGAKVVTDLYIESLSVPGGPAPTYVDMLKHDVTAIVNALK